MQAPTSSTSRPADSPEASLFFDNLPPPNQKRSRIVALQSAGGSVIAFTIAFRFSCVKNHSFTFEDCVQVGVVQDILEILPGPDGLDYDKPNFDANGQDTNSIDYDIEVDGASYVCSRRLLLKLKDTRQLIDNSYYDLWAFQDTGDWPYDNRDQDLLPQNGLDAQDGGSQDHLQGSAQEDPQAFRKGPGTRAPSLQSPFDAASSSLDLVSSQTSSRLNAAPLQLFLQEQPCPFPLTQVENVDGLEDFSENFAISSKTQLFGSLCIRDAVKGRNICFWVLRTGEADHCRRRSSASQE